MKNNPMAVLGSLCFVVLVIVWSAVWTGITLSVTWGWFVAPKFGLPIISIAEAYGLSLIVGIFRNQSKPDDAAKAFAEVAVLAPFKAMLILGVGWIVKIWI